MLFWRKLSTRRQFVLLGLLFFLLLTLLLVLINDYVIHQTVENFNANITSTVDRMNFRLTDYAQYLNKFMTSLAYDPIVQDFMASKNATERFSNRVLLNRRLNQMNDITEGILSFVVYPAGGLPAINELQIPMFDIATFPEPPDYRLLITSMNEYHLAVTLSSTFSSYMLALNSYSVRQNAPTNTFLGTVYVLLDGSKLGKSLGIIGVNDDTDYYVLDHNDHVVFSTKAISGEQFTLLTPASLPEEKVVTMKNNGVDDIVYKVTNPDMGMVLLSITPTSSILGNINQVIQSELVIFATLLIISIIIFFILERSAIRPLYQMAKYVNQVQASQGKRTSQLDLRGSREANLLSRNFNQMLDSIETLNRQITEAEVYKKQTEIAMLKSQINPHFLYNTLETIRGMAYSTGNEEIARMTFALAQVFRYSIKSPEFVELKYEIAMVKDYLSIQQVRFADRFCTHMDIHPDTMGCLLPKMLLQPLVENAIQHGIELLESDGELLIRSTIEQGELVIIVKDNGVGMDAEALEQLKQELRQQEGLNINNSGNSVKIGVVNVHGRIQRYYGAGYGLEISSEPGIGFTASFHLPIRRSDHV